MLAPHILAQCGVDDTATFFFFLHENGYKHVRVLRSGDIAATIALAYTDAIVTGINFCGYADRWCYQKTWSHGLAAAALQAWSGEDGTEPAKWHRHPDSGRRRDKAGREYVLP